ncbi:hypothetical protein V8D89_001561 [Ganoderma adspersum]
MSNIMTADASEQVAEAALILASLNCGGTIGVVNIGVSISAMIYEITCIQTFQYYHSEKSKDDARGIQMLLYGPSQYVLAFAIALMGHISKTSFICQATILVTGVITLFADGFFIVRIWRVKRNQVLVAICILVAVAHIATNFDAETKLKILNLYQKMGTGALSVGPIKNVIICSIMVWCLSSKTATTKWSADMIERLIILTVSGGMLTTMSANQYVGGATPRVFEIATLIAYVAAPSQLYNLMFQIILGKLIRLPLYHDDPYRTTGIYSCLLPLSTSDRFSNTNGS